MHQYVPDDFVLHRGLTSYWGYNTIGYFAPHAAYSAAVDTSLLSFVRELVALRLSHPVFRRHRYLTGVEAAGLGWFTPAGTPMTQADSFDPGAVASAPRRRAGNRVTVGPRSVLVLRGPRRRIRELP